MDAMSKEEASEHCAKHSGDANEHCLSGFELGHGMGCEATCEARAEGAKELPDPYSPMISAAREPSCVAVTKKAKNTACHDGYDYGVAFYISAVAPGLTAAGGGGFIGGLFKLIFRLAVLAALSVFHPKVEELLVKNNALPPPARQAIVQVKAKVADLVDLVKDKLQKRPPSNLPGNMKPKGSLTVGYFDIGGKGEVTPTFAAGMRESTAKEFAVAFTSNTGSVMIITPSMSSSNQGPEDLRSTVSAPLGTADVSNSKAAVEEACKEFVATIEGKMNAAGVDHTTHLYSKLVTLLVGEDPALLMKKLSDGSAVHQLKHIITIGESKLGADCVHVLTVGFVGGPAADAPGNRVCTPYRLKMVSANLLDDNEPHNVTRIKYSVAPTSRTLSDDILSDGVGELQRAVEGAGWDAYLEADMGGGGGAPGAADPSASQGDKDSGV